MARIRVVLRIKGVELVVGVVAHHDFAKQVHLAVGPVPRERRRSPIRPLMPRAGSDVQHPSGVRRREVQDVESVAFLLVGERHRVRDVGVLLDLPLDGVRGHPLPGVAVGAVHDAVAACVRPQPEQRVVELGDRVCRSAPDLVERALDPRQGEVRRPLVVPDLDGVVAEQPDFAVIDNQRHHIVGQAFGTGKVQRIDLSAVQQRGDPKFLAVGFVEHEVPIQIPHGHGAGERGVKDLSEHARVVVVDVAVRVARHEKLRAVVGHADRAGAGDRADQRGGPRRGHTVQFVARHYEPYAFERPKAPDRAGANGRQFPQPRCAGQEAYALAAFGSRFGEQVDHAAVCRID